MWLLLNLRLVLLTGGGPLFFVLAFESRTALEWDGVKWKSHPHGLPSPRDRCRPGRQTVSDDGLFNPAYLSCSFVLLDAAHRVFVSVCAFLACQDFVNSPVPVLFFTCCPVVRFRDFKGSVLSWHHQCRTQDPYPYASGLPLSPSRLTRVSICVFGSRRSFSPLLNVTAFGTVLFEPGHPRTRIRPTGDCAVPRCSSLRSGS